MAIRFLPSGGYLHRIHLQAKNREEARKASSPQEPSDEEKTKLDREMVEMISNYLPVWQDN